MSHRSFRDSSNLSLGLCGIAIVFVGVAMAPKQMPSFATVHVDFRIQIEDNQVVSARPLAMDWENDDDGTPQPKRGRTSVLTIRGAPTNRPGLFAAPLPAWPLRPSSSGSAGSGSPDGLAAPAPPSMIGAPAPHAPAPKATGPASGTPAVGPTTLAALGPRANIMGIGPGRPIAGALGFSTNQKDGTLESYTREPWT